MHFRDRNENRVISFLFLCVNILQTSVCIMEILFCKFQLFVEIKGLLRPNTLLYSSLMTQNARKAYSQVLINYFDLTIIC